MNITKDELKEAVEAAVHAVQSNTPRIERREAVKEAKEVKGADPWLSTSIKTIVVSVITMTVLFAASQIPDNKTRITIMESRQNAIEALMADVKDFMKEERFTESDFKKGLEANLVPVVAQVNANRALAQTNVDELKHRRDILGDLQSKSTIYDSELSVIRRDISDIKEILKRRDK